MTERWTILGTAVQSDPQRPSPHESLNTLTPETVDETVTHWSGRWLLVGDGQIWTDASAMCRCYYRQYKGQTFASMRPQELPGTLAIEDERALKAGWVVPPRSGYIGVRLLLPSQRLNIDTGEVSPRKVFGHLPPLPCDEARLDELAIHYRTILYHLASGHRTVWLGLSSGKDSRLLLAAAAGHGCELGTYTFARDPGKISRGDMEIPPQLARLAGVTHDLITPQVFDTRKAEAFTAANGPCQTSPSSFYVYYARGQMDGFPSGSILMNGLCGEFGRGYYHRKLPRFPNADEMYRVLYGKTDRNYRGLLDLQDWWLRHHIDMDHRERFYWGVRLAGWASVASAQIAAVTDLTYLSPFNCAATMQRTLELSETIRHSGEYIRRLIRRLCPALDTLPYNPPDPFWRRTSQHVKRLMARAG